MQSIRAIVTEGRIEPLETFSLPDGTEVIVTVAANGDNFWLNASASVLDEIWGNSEDDIYSELLKR